MSETSPGRSPPPAASGGRSSNAQNAGGDSSGGGRRPPRGGRGSRPNRNVFLGKEEKLKGHVYDVTPFKSGKVFAKTTKEIAEFAAREYAHAGEFRQALQSLKYADLSPPAWKPANADKPTVPETEEYKLLFKEYYDKKNKREENQKKIFALILGQCSPAMKDRLEGSDKYESINNNNDPVELLSLIRDCLYQKNVVKKPVHAIIDAETELLNIRQEPNQSLASYYEKFKEVVQVYEQNNGEQPGISTARVNEKLITNGVTDPDFATDDERKKAQDDVTQEYLACLFMLRSDPNKYAELVTDIENRYARSSKFDEYPKTLVEAYNVLNSYKFPTRPR